MSASEPLKDLHLLPKIRDSWSYLYVEHARIDKEDRAIAAHDARGKTLIPCANLAVLILGPGTTVTHAAVRVLAECGCLVIWAGEENVRFYAQGMGETRSSRHLLLQASLSSHPVARLQVVRRMYTMRFPDPLGDDLTLSQIRGMEGIRVREAYARASRGWGVTWSGRAYRRNSWAAADPVNRALSAANSALYGVVHASIVSAGYSTALGFIHTGKMLSFVYDIADLYKVEFSVPVAFEAASQASVDLERTVRIRCRDYFRVGHLLERIVPDIEHALAVPLPPVDERDLDDDAAAALPGGLWDPLSGTVEGGVSYGSEERNGADSSA